MRDLDTLRCKVSTHGRYVGAYFTALLEHPLPRTKMRQVYRLLPSVTGHPIEGLKMRSDTSGCLSGGSSAAYTGFGTTAAGV